MGLIKREIISLEYYLNNLEDRRLIELKFVRGKERTLIGTMVRKH